MDIIIPSPKTEEVLPNYEILEFYRGDDTHTELTIQCYDMRFHITVSATNIQDDVSTTKEYMSLLRKLDSEDSTREVEEDSESEGDAMENMCFWIASKCNSAMRVLSSREEKTQVRTLHDWFYAKTLVLVLRARDGKLYVCSSSSLYQQDFAPMVTLSHSVCKLNIPSIEASNITILLDETDEETLIRRPKKVSVGSNTIRFYKPTYTSEQANREITSLIHIKSTNLSNIIRTPTLHELVKSPENHTSISGILLEYIPHHNTLADIDLDNTPVSIRVRWQDQLQSMVHSLHSAGVIWGDARTDNVLVDVDDILWIIDFGGGVTEGWVDGDKADSREGDLQALSKIIEILDFTGLAM
ncbi:hypothetical protein BDV24DRAFT_171120 [Aspergillus arachidicola]|uniref:Protein kinase domain-containing protein n=1 Tax=Aspergillus arachidicola TaxID=656916 RepID=A0A5N6XTG9_9EURO|nr:hypothetical protein BDV24DRAFT_171120 [Aspergillus arachidicola]